MLIENNTLRPFLGELNLPSVELRRLKEYRQFYDCYPQIGRAVIAQLKQQDMSFEIGRSAIAQFDSENSQTDLQDFPEVSPEDLLTNLAFTHFLILTD